MLNLQERYELSRNTGRVISHLHGYDVVEVTNTEASLLIRGLNSPFTNQRDFQKEYPNVLGLNFGRIWVLADA